MKKQGKNLEMEDKIKYLKLLRHRIQLSDWRLVGRPCESILLSWTHILKIKRTYPSKSPLLLILFVIYMKIYTFFI